MIEFLIVMAAADSELVVPGGMILTAASLFALGMRTYKESRNIDVGGERTRRIAAEERERATEAGLQAKLQPLKDEIAELKREIQEMRAEQALRQDSHDRETEELRERLRSEWDKNFRLRKIISDNGLPIPEGLGPS